MKNLSRSAVAAAWALLSAAAAAAPLRPVTMDDEMKFRAIVDVKIAPDGERVAYVVSTPSLSKNEHEAALYVVSARGGPPRLSRCSPSTAANRRSSRFPSQAASPGR